ncbi:MAG: C-GCAxxG-C-C family (seleno)protein [Clostridia bacterium]|nr:C-GCAxxG-C-C family (seleno)protein [Clostridia bacterium]
METIEVVAALIRDRDTFLLCRRPQGKARAGLWEFPGGKVEQGETKDAAILRECREELGVRLVSFGPLMALTHAYPEVTVHLTLMDCRVAEGVITRLEHDDMRFVTTAEAAALALCPADQSFLAELSARESAGERHAARARELFGQGCNCAQAVLCAYAQEIGLPERTLRRLGSSFGGGMGGLRAFCGAATGAFMALGLLEGYDDPHDQEAKKAHYAKIRSISEAFCQEHGTLCCRELLASLPGKLQSDPLPRTQEYYKIRPCVRFVETGAKLVSRFLKAEE